MKPSALAEFFFMAVFLGNGLDACLELRDPIWMTWPSLGGGFWPEHDVGIMVYPYDWGAFEIT